MTVRVGTADFDISAEVARIAGNDTDIGGVAVFVGKVRGRDGDEELTSLTLEHYPGMTEAELERIETEAQHRFNLSASRIVHRVGTLKPGDNIVLVVACAPPPPRCFCRRRFLMDYLKTQAPFWKQETLANGESRWVDAKEADDTAAAAWRSKSD